MPTADIVLHGAAAILFVVGLIAAWVWLGASGIKWALQRKLRRLRHQHGHCESCGAPADLSLKDGSLWCIGCDIAARHLGYDNQPAKLIKHGRDSQ